MKTLRGTSSADLRLVLDEIKELRPQDIRRGVLIEYPERDLKLSYLFPKLGIHLGTGLIREIISATIGAIVLLILIRLVRGGTA